MDGATGREWRPQGKRTDYWAPEDYAIVSRILASYSGEPLIVAAGTMNVGTQAAAEFLTNPQRLNDALRQLPPGWQNRNLQFVLHCKAIGLTAGPAEVVAAHVW